jgi:hypothetical protein
MDPACMSPPFTAAISLLVPLCVVTACKDTQLPDLTVPVGANTTFGTDLRAKDPVLGVTIIDPLGRLPG